MGCERNYPTGNCVCDILAEIVEHQDDVTQDCLGSCSESIRELMGGVAPSNFNTVPVQLICNSPNTAPPYESPLEGGYCGNVFIAQGFRRVTGAGSAHGVLERVTSTFFKVKSVDTDNCCAVLELLCVKEEHPRKSHGTDLKYGPDPDDLDECLGDNVFIPFYTSTGICITVDLNCFCGVSCLPAAYIPMS